MRITTKMLNESARRAGLPINNISLLNYVRGNGNNTSLLQAMNQKKEKTVNPVKKENYEKLDKAAEQLTKSAEGLLQKGEKSLFEQSKTSGDNLKVYDGIEKFFENYNSALKALKNTSNTINDFYREMLAEASDEVEKKLADIGIAFTKDGTATVDMQKVKAVDLGTLEDLFGKDSKFVKRVEILATRISDNAEANMKSISSTYRSGGNMNDTKGRGKYEFWG